MKRTVVIIAIVVAVLVIVFISGVVGGLLNSGSDSSFDSQDGRSAGLREILQTELPSEDIIAPGSSDCAFDPVGRTFTIAGGASCTYTLTETAGFLTRHASLWVTQGTASVTLIPGEEKAVTANKLMNAGDVFSGLDVYAAGGELVIACLSEPCTLILEE
jgi:hypothetical protein